LIGELFPASKASATFAQGVEKVIRLDTAAGKKKHGFIDSYYGNAVIEFENSLMDPAHRESPALEPAAVELAELGIPVAVHREGDAASIETCASRVLWGFVYRVSAEDKDGLKDRERGYAEKPLKALLVEDTSDCENCTPVDAFTFVGETACPDRCGPADAYFKLVVDGAKKRRLPEEYIRDLEAQAASK